MIPYNSFYTIYQLEGRRGRPRFGFLVFCSVQFESSVKLSNYSVPDYLKGSCLFRSKSGVIVKVILPSMIGLAS